MDTALPVGLRSAPKVFNVVADAIEWIVNGMALWHYSVPG